MIQTSTFALASLGLSSLGLFASLQIDAPNACGAPAPAFLAHESLTQDEEAIVGADMPFGPVSDEMKQIASAQTGFGLALHRQLISQGGAGNVVTSPLSVWTALAMLERGANAKTRDEIKELLGVTAECSESDVRRAIKSLRSHLQRAEAKGLELRLADAIWMSEGFEIVDGVLDDLRFAFNAEPARLDFAGNIEAATAKINAWIAEHTAGRIKKMLKPDALSPLTSLVLTDAVYFKGAWEFPFEPKLTGDGIFRRADGTEVIVPFMRLPETETFRATSLRDADANVDATVVEIPYAGRAFSLTLIVPKEVDGLDEVEAWMTADRLAKALEGLEEQSMKVSLPKLRIEPRIDLEGPLFQMGLQTAFDAGRADFTRFTQASALAVSEVKHAVFLEFSEEGTEAAAATVVTLKRSMAPRTVAADRPFLMLIRERESGAPLFFGRIMDPTE